MDRIKKYINTSYKCAQACKFEDHSVCIFNVKDKNDIFSLEKTQMTILSRDLSKLEWLHSMAYLALGSKDSEEREETGIKEDRIWFCETESGQHVSRTVWADLTTLLGE